jgi:hypothetical protein
MFDFLKNKLLFLLFILLTMKLNAQEFITGKVVNNQGSIITSVNIMPQGSSSTISKADGSFEILCPEDSTSIRVHFSHIGYKTKNIRLYNGEKNIEILLMDSVLPMNEVTISSPKYSRYSNYAAQVIKMNPFEVYTNPHALGDIFSGLQILPGVQRNDNDGRLIIQGGAPNESQTFKEGFILFNQYT